MNSSEKMSSETADEDLARLLHEANFFDEPNVKDLKLEPPTYQQLRLQFTRKSKKILTDGGNTLNKRRKRRKRGKSNVDNSQEENKENQAARSERSDEFFLQEWHNDEVEIADFRSSDDSQDEQLEEWYKNMKSNKARDINLPPVNDNAKNVGPVIQHESSIEEKSWLQTDIADMYLLDMLANYTAADNPHEIMFEDLVEPRQWIEKTHLIAEYVMVMKKNRIFTILRKNRPRNLLTHLRLGYCVTHNPGRPKCQQKGQICTLQCNICGVCCHMYSCTCRLVKRFDWCAHIHAAVLCGGNKFKNDQQVYLHISSRYTQLSHLRATCFDLDSDVKPVENDVDAYTVMGWTTEWTPFSVLRLSEMDVCHVCPQYKRCPECSTCRHEYLCACAEYILRKRLCEHCHVVAIFLSENRVNTLKKREFRYLSDVSDDTDEETDPERDVSPMLLSWRKISAHHEKSYSIPLKRIQVGSLNDQLVYFVRRCDPEQRFVVHTQNRAHCTCSKNVSSLNVECTDCRMCPHYLTCNCDKADAEFCKHTHAVRRYIVRSYTPTDRTIESTLGIVIRRALSSFYGSCDTDEISCDPSLVTEENIMAVVENLKLALSGDIEVELPNTDELRNSCDNSVESNVNNSEAVSKEINRVFDSNDESNEKILDEVENCIHLNSDSLENDPQNFEPVFEKNDYSYCGTAEDDGAKSAAEIIEHNLLKSNSTTGIFHQQPVLGKTSSDYSDTNIPAKINELKLLSSNSAERIGYSLKSDLNENYAIDSSKAGESAMVEENTDSEKQLQSVQKRDFVSANDSETSSIVENEFQTNESRVCKKDENEVFTLFDYSRIKTLRSFYDLKFEPVVEIRYKGNVGASVEGYPKVMAESSRCIVVVNDSTRESSPCPESVMQQNFFCDSETMKKYKNSVSEETDKFRRVSEIFKQSCIKESCSDSNSVLPKDFSRNFGIIEDNENTVSTKTRGSSFVAEELKLSNIKDSAVNWEPVLIENLSWFSEAKKKDKKMFSTNTGAPSVVNKAKDLEKNCSTGSASNVEPAGLFDFEHTSGGFETDKEDENLVPKERSGFTSYGKAFKRKSSAWLSKLNLVKSCKKPQKEKNSFSQFFGRNTSRSRRQRELAVLQSISEDFADTDIFYENYNLR